MRKNLSIMIVLGMGILLLIQNSSLAQSEGRSVYVPDGYELSFNDECDELYLDIEADGSDYWTTWFVGWDVRYLGGNNDKAWKCDSTYSGGNTEPLGIPLHEATDYGTMKLLGLETPKEKKDIVNQFPYIGGMISNQLYHWQLYGYFEIKARFDISQGHHWAIWLLPTDNTWPPEIDIVEIVSPYYNAAFTNAHGQPKSKSNLLSKEMSSEGPVLGVDVSEYHHFGFEWRPDSLKWTIDGRVVYRLANYINKPMYLLISPEIGGNWPGMPTEKTVWPMVCEIDHIRIYEYDEESDIHKSDSNYQNIPKRFGLLNNYPNPFNPTTTLQYNLPQSGNISIDVFNSNGIQVKNLIDHFQHKGSYQLSWNACDSKGSKLESGVYFVRLTLRQNETLRTDVRKIMLLK